MNIPIKINSAQEALEFIRERDLPYVRVGLFDIDGVFRGKYINRDKFESSLEKGLGFCDVAVGWDSNDQLYDNVKVTGWHTGYPDAAVRLLPDTMRLIPFEDDLPLFLCEFLKMGRCLSSWHAPSGIETCLRYGLQCKRSC